MTDLTTLKGLGPVTARRLTEVDIGDVACLRQLGAVEAYLRLCFAFPRHTSLNALWALQGALTGRHWTNLSAAEKADLLSEVARLSGRPASD